MENGDGIIAMVIASTIVMLIIALTVIYFVTYFNRKYLIQQTELQRKEHEKQMAVLEAIITTQEGERNRIARNLHDSIGAELSMVKLNLSRYLYFIKDPHFETDKFSNDLKSLDQTIENISQICKDLYPLTLQRYGLASTIEGILLRLKETGSINCSFENSVKENELGLNFENKLHLFRVFQEVLNNIIKHSNCKNLVVNMQATDAFIEINFKHNGNEFTDKKMEQLIVENRGIGLGSINNRVSLLNGKINYLTDSKGSGVLIELPKKYDR